MATRWQYPRWRRVTMQVAMWGVFAASLGVAAMLSNRPMQRAASDGPLLPYGWVQVHRTTDTDPSLVLRAEEPTTDGSGRSLTLRVLPAGPDATAMQFLARRGLPVQLDDGADGPDGGDDTAPLQIDMVGRTGLITGGPMIATVGGRRIVAHAYFASAVVPGQFAVLAALEGIGPPQPDDIDILRRVAESLALKDLGVDEISTAAPPPQAPPEPAAAVDPSGQLTLSNGTRLAVPAGYNPVAATDPLATRRSLVKGTAAVLDLVPCVVLGTDTDDDRVALAELHDPAFHGGSVRIVRHGIAGLRQWQILPPAGGGPAAAGAYLVADPSGSAVLALFRGSGAAAAAASSAYDVAWQALVAEMRFAPGHDLNQRAAAGERVAERLRAELRAGPAKLVAEHWWLWFRDGDDPLVGWSAQEPADPAKPMAGVRRSVWREGNAVRRCEDRWEHDAPLTAYGRQTVADDGGTGTAKQFVRLAGGQLFFSDGAGAPPRDARRAPRQFVPGPVLEATLGRLPHDQPLLLRTDSFPGAEPCIHSGLLTLLIDPAPPRDPAATGLDTLRSLAVTVNGSGETSRWYINPDGTVAQIDLPAGLHRKPSTEAEIENSFSNDPRMRP